MKLRKQDNYYIWEGGFESRHLPKSAGFRWFSGEKNKWAPKGDIVPPKHWWTDNIEKAVALADYADDSCKDELLAYKNKKEENVIASVSTDADINIPAPPGLDYYPYQKAGIAFGIRNDSVLNADDMGLGKTIQSVGILNAIDWNSAIIICPASLKFNWKRELETWLVKDKKVEILSSKSDQVEADIYIVNYDLLFRNNFEWLLNKKFDVCIVDEVHFVKNPKAKRSIATYKISKNSKKRVFLSGTPILNKPIEIYPILEHLGFKMSKWEFAKKYCGLKKGKFGWDMSGASNLEDLQLKLRGSMMIRRRKQDVLAELPPKTRQVILLDPEKYQIFLQKEQDLMAKIKAKKSYNDIVEYLTEYSADDIAEIAKLRHQLALAKLPDVYEHIDNTLNNVEKIIVFAHHRDVIDAIYEKYKDMAVKLYGGMSEKDRQDAVDSFQNDPNCRIFVGAIKAAGVGLTLTAASTVIFVELDWVPANLTQAEDRAHRIGQTDNVLVQHIVVDGSIDATLAKRIVEKQNIADKSLNYEHLEEFKKREDARKAELLKKIKEQEQKRIEYAKRIKEENEKRLQEAQKRREAKDQADGIPVYSDEVKNEVHRRLKVLAGMCDGACDLDGQGFNRLDTAFGHSLANASKLSNRQCHYAIQMLKKYKSQIGDISEILES